MSILLNLFLANSLAGANVKHIFNITTNFLKFILIIFFAILIDTLHVMSILLNLILANSLAGANVN